MAGPINWKVDGDMIDDDGGQRPVPSQPVGDATAKMGKEDESECPAADRGKKRHGVADQHGPLTKHRSTQYLDQVQKKIQLQERLRFRRKLAGGPEHWRDEHHHLHDIADQGRDVPIAGANDAENHRHPGTIDGHQKETGNDEQGIDRDLDRQRNIYGHDDQNIMEEDDDVSPYGNVV